MPNCLAIDFSSPSTVVVLQIILLAVHASLIVYKQHELTKEMDGVHERLDRIFADRIRPIYDPTNPKNQVPPPVHYNQPPYPPQQQR
jgi:hypothetical protein